MTGCYVMIPSCNKFDAIISTEVLMLSLYRTFQFKKLILTPFYSSIRYFVGTSNFDGMVLHRHTSGAAISLPFVDKSMFAKAVIDATSSAILITQPRRSGKSMSLDMLEKFLAIEVDSEGNKIKDNSYKILFEGGEKKINGKEVLLNRLKIGEYDLYMNEQGRYPVIKLDFKDLTSREVETIARDIKLQFQFIYKKYGLIENENKLEKELSNIREKLDTKATEIGKSINVINNIALELIHATDSKEESEKYRKALKKQQKKLEKQQTKLERQQTKLEQQYTELKEQFKSNPKNYLKNMVKDLCSQLERKYGEKVYVLIDEYDKPVNAFIEMKKISDYNDNERCAVVDMLSGFLSAIGKGNGSVKKLVMIGIFNTLQIEGNSGLNNVISYGVTSEHFSEYFGFTKKEIDEQLINKLSSDHPLLIQSKENFEAKLKEWYNGYNVWTNEGEHRAIYSAWSTTRFLNEFIKNQNTVPGPYWTASGVNIVLKNFRIREDKLGLLKELGVEKKLLFLLQLR